MDPSSEPVFAARGLERRYGSVVALQGVNVEAPGRAIGLLGPNGAGKSTMLKILIGLVPPSAGDATVLGLDVRRQRLAIREKIGFVPEDECVFPHMEGIVAVTHAAQLCGLRFTDALKRAHEVLDFVGLHEERYREVDTYSTGMKQLLKVAQALVHDPQLLVLDEPTNGVDPDNRDALVLLVRELVSHGLLVIVSSHLLSDVEAICDSVVMMDRGRVIEAGQIAALRARGQDRLRCEVLGDARPLASALEQRGFAVELREGGTLDLVPPDGAADTLVAEQVRELGLGLVRLERVRDSLQDLFLSTLQRGRQADVGAQEVGA